jgi:hypothetical protein
LRKNANFFAENWQKSLKIVIITSTPSVTLRVSPFFLPAKVSEVRRNFSCSRPWTWKKWEEHTNLKFWKWDAFMHAGRSKRP